MELSVDVSEIIALAKRSEAAPQHITQELSKAGRFSGLAVERMAKSLIPVATGNAKALTRMEPVEASASGVTVLADASTGSIRVSAFALPVATGIRLFAMRSTARPENRPAFDNSCVMCCGAASERLASAMISETSTLSSIAPLQTDRRQLHVIRARLFHAGRFKRAALPVDPPSLPSGRADRQAEDHL